MFVSSGAADKIRLRRKQTFYEIRLAELLLEAKSLGITKDELIEQIGKEEN